MTPSEIINLALRQITEPIIREHISDIKRRDLAKRDVSVRRERLEEIRFYGQAE